MVRVLAPLFLVPAFAEESLMQAHDLDAGVASGASKTQRMRQSSQAMEDQYVALLSNIVKSGSWTDPATGNPWVPKADILSPVVGVINDMDGELVTQKDANNQIMKDHVDSIASINANMKSSLTSHFNNEGVAMQNARTAHNTCRGQENTAITTMETNCKTFKDEQKCPNEHGLEQDWYAAIREGGGSGTGPSGSLQDIVDKAVVCKGNIGATSAKATECDGLQDDHKAAMCAYVSEVTSTCSAHHSSWTNALSGYNQATQSITKLESEQKTILRMLGRIRCYMELLFRGSKGMSMPEQSDINACQSTPIEDSKLDITYGTPEPEAPCLDSYLLNGELVDKVPGDGAWYSKEYGSTRFSDHEKMTADSSC